MTQQKQLLPFRFGTRQHIAFIGSVPHTDGQPITFRLPNVGFLTKLYLQFVGSVSPGATIPVPFADWRYPFGLANRISLSANVGNTDVIAVSGPMAKLIDSTFRRSPEFMAATPNAPTGLESATIPATYTASTPAALSFVIPLYVTPNDGSNFDEGAINLQSTELQVNLNVSLGNEASIFGTVGTSAITGTWNLYYKYYEVPDPSQVAYPVAMWHAFLSQQFQLTSSGDNTYTIPLQGTLLRLFCRMYNSTTSLFDASKFNSLSVKFDKATTIYAIPNFLLGEMLTKSLPQWNYHASALYPQMEPGAFILDLFNASDLAGHGDTRDAINTQAIAATDFVFNQLSQASGDYIEICRQIVAPFIVNG